MLAFHDAFVPHVKITYFELEFKKILPPSFMEKENISFFFHICDNQLKDSVWKFSYKLSIRADKIQNTVLVYSDRAFC